jgi:hypothetical protein
MLHSFRTLWPETMSALPNLRFVEQYDPLDEVNKSQPYAYVADVVEEIPLSADIDDIRGRGVSNEQWAALMELRDQLAKDAKVSWYVVVCGDEDRYVPSQSASVYSQEEDTEVETTPPRSVLRSAGSRVGLFAGSSSKTTQHSSPPIREKTSSAPGGARTPTPSSSHRPTMSAESRSSRANTPAMTRTATSESTRAAEPSRGKQRERPPEVRRVRFDDSPPSIYSSNKDQQERSGSLGRLGRIFGVKESKR